MKKLMDHGKFAPQKGLAAKLIKFVVGCVLGIGLTCFLITMLQLHILSKMVEQEEQLQADLVQEKSMESVSLLTQDSLLQLNIWAADQTDDEFWTLYHDIQVLGEQVRDILAHPEKYETMSVEPPKKENTGVFRLQLLCPGAYEDISPETMEKMGKLANLGPMMQEIVSGNEGRTLDCYIATPDGVSLAIDALSEGKYDENGQIKPYDATTRPWYQNAVAEGGVVYSPAHSHFYNFNEVIFGYPVYVDNKVAAVLQLSTRLDVIEQKLAERNIGKNSFSILVSDEGQLVCSPRTEGELKTREDVTEDIRSEVNSTLEEVINLALSGETGVALTEVDGELYYTGYTQLNTLGWIQLAFVSAEELHAPAQSLVNDMETLKDNMILTMRGYFRLSAIVMVLVLAAVVVVTVMTIRSVAKKRVEPVNRMTEKVRKFTDEDMQFEMEELYKTGDEIQVLAESFETMSKKMKSYVEEIVAISTEKERIDAEMKMATQIQVSMLPRNFPAFPDRPEFELYAEMVPAKNVGGDFYDFFFVDEDHLALVMADVSGKGITAALFMALSKQVLQSQLLIHGGDVVAAVTAANLKLLEESLADMFVTVWIGVLTISTGKMFFVDAGHEYPVVQRAGGSFAVEEDSHSIPIAALSFAKFNPNEMTLHPGDMLFLFTDGVTEAHNEKNELFGMDHLVAVLNENPDLPPKELDEHVRQRIAEFSGNAEQFDDITTLCFKYLGPAETGDGSVSPNVEK